TLRRSGVSEMKDAIKPAGALGQRRIQLLRVIRGRKKEHSLERMKPVDPVEEVAQSLMLRRKEGVHVLKTENRRRLQSGLVERLVQFSPFRYVGHRVGEERFVAIRGDDPDRARLSVSRRPGEQQAAPVRDLQFGIVVALGVE